MNRIIENLLIHLFLDRLPLPRQLKAALKCAHLADTLSSPPPRKRLK